MTFWCPFWRFFLRSSITALLCHHRPFRPVLLLLQTTRAREKSRWAVVRHAVVVSAVWHQSTFRSVSGPGPRTLWGDAGSQSGRTLALSLCSNVAMPFWADSQNRSALYTCPKYLERWVYTSWKRVPNRTDPSSLRTSWTLVELALKYVWNRFCQFFLRTRSLGIDSIHGE